MKLKRIISTALTVVMIFTALAAALPITASAVYTETSASAGANVPAGVEPADLSSEQIKEYISEYLSYNFNTAAEMLGYEIEKGYLYYVNSSGNAYTIYVNKYTGFVYYVNNITGQILTSNPVNPGYTAVSEAERRLLMSQITVDLVEVLNSEKTHSLDSVLWAANRSQISVTPIKGGLRVNYTLGDTTSRFLLPGQITAEAFEEHIFKPILEKYENLLNKYCFEERPDENFSFFDNDDYIPYEYGCINSSSTKTGKGVLYYLAQTAEVYKAILPRGDEARKELDSLSLNIQSLIKAYNLKSPEKEKDNQKRLEAMYNEFPITKDGIAIYVCTVSNSAEAKYPVASIIKKHCPNYTFAMMYQHEKECGYVDESINKPVVRCALEYTFNEDGSLSVTLPASSITFDESYYNFERITPLQYFGCGDMTKDGYMFYPDGSGAIIEFDDFYNEEAGKKLILSLESSVYGNDFCYSKIIGSHRQQITMPVYGLVNETNYGLTEELTVTNGYFAIIEEGSSLAKLGFKSGGAMHKFANVYASYEPYPSDEYDLSDTISVGSLGTYTIVSESKYTGSYVTRYVMLTDEEIGDKVYGEGAYYKSDYVGMASYYRNYLKDNGVLEALETVSEDLPLYIEVLGAMDITAKFLSFPVTKTVPLTTFDDISTIYKELSECEEFVLSRIEEFKQLLEEEKDEAQIYHYNQLIAKYSELVGQIKNISNINFKLTGFANGGMKSTYPVKLRWEKACGGKSGFKALLKEANAISKTEGTNFSIFPEFDFMFINNTSMFDGISNKGNVSKMVDDRYASKQVYNAVLQSYEKTFALVINPDAIEELYGKFEKKYSKYDVNGISLSTIGSTLNSNFDEDAPINRDEAMTIVSELLDKIADDDGYEIMADKGNMYTLKYVTHILNAALEGSHYRYSSYTVPFLGLVLHSYVNYTGTPINYSGSAEYDMLRAIENGASLYYVLCYRNNAYLKDSKSLSQYFGVDYNNWYDSIVKTYTELNNAIGDLQKYEIVDHKILIAERIIDEKESAANLVRLQNEAIVLLDNQILGAVNDAMVILASDPANANKRVKLDITDENRAAIMMQFADALNRTVEEIEANGFGAAVDAVIAKYEAEYTGAANPADTYTVNFADIEYSTKYSYVTDSLATDKNYIYTDFTNDSGNVTMVTYQSGDSVVKFVLNYNNYPVAVRLANDNIITLEAYGYTRIEEVK